MSQPEESREKTRHDRSGAHAPGQRSAQEHRRGGPAQGPRRDPGGTRRRVGAARPGRVSQRAVRLGLSGAAGRRRSAATRRASGALARTQVKWSSVAPACATVYRCRVTGAAASFPQRWSTVSCGVYWSSSTLTASTGVRTARTAASVSVPSSAGETAGARGVCPVADHAARLPAAETPTRPDAEQRRGGGDPLGVRQHAVPAPARVVAPVGDADRDQRQPVDRVAAVQGQVQQRGLPAERSARAAPGCARPGGA